MSGTPLPSAAQEAHPQKPSTLYDRIRLTRRGADLAVAVLALLLLGAILLAAATGGLTVTLDANGGDAVASVRCRHGEHLSKLPAPQRAGYRFTGWYTDSACTRRWEPAYAVTASLTLYAGWEPEAKQEPLGAIAPSGSC